MDCFPVIALLCKQKPPLGPMPNEEIDVGNLESLEKYCSYTRYLRNAKEADNRPVWWKTYRSYVEKADPEHGEKYNAHLWTAIHWWLSWRDPLKLRSFNEFFLLAQV